MAKFLRRQDGVTPVVAVLVILVVGIVGVAALRTSDAYFRPQRPINRFPTTTRTVPPISSGSFSNTPSGTSGSFSNTGTSVSCRSGETRIEVTGTGSAYCQSSSSGSTGTTTNTCIVNGQQIEPVDGKCQYSSQAANGAPGTSRCTVNGQEVPCQ